MHLGAIYKLSILLFSCIALLFSKKCQSQGVAELDTFNHTIHKGDDFSDQIRMFRNGLVEREAFDSLRLLDKYVNELQDYCFDDVFVLRKAYTYHARPYEKYLGDYKSAKVYYEYANDLLMPDQILNDPWLWFIENPLGNIYTRLGDYERASYMLNLVASNLKYSKKYDKVSRIYNNLGLVYRYQLDFERAIKSYRTGIEIAKSVDFGFGVELNRMNLIQALLEINDTLQAKNELLLVDTSDINQFELLDMYLEVQALYSSKVSKNEEAICYFNQLIEVMDSIYPDRNRREYAKIYHELGLEYMQLGQVEKAKKQVKLGLYCLGYDDNIMVDFTSALPENTIAELYKLLGDMYGGLYHESKNELFADSSLMAYDRSIYVNELLRDKYIEDGSMLVAGSIIKEVVNEAVELLFKVQEDTNNDKSEEAQKYMAFAKGVVLNRSISQKQVMLKATEIDQKTFSNNIKEIQKLRDKSDEQSGQKIIKLISNNQSILNKYQEAPQFYKGVYIDFLATDNWIYSVDNLSSIPRLSALCLADSLLHYSSILESKILKQAPTKSVNNTSKKIYKLLFKKLGDLPKRFSIIPDGMISKIPIDLMTKDGYEYLIQNHHIEYRLSKQLIQDKGQMSRVYCLTPSYGKAVAHVSQSYSRSEIYPLYFTNKEAEYISNIYEDTEIVVRTDDFSEALNNADIFHFAGHARTDNSRGALILSENSEDKITGLEISFLPSKLSLAVLSACETGLGKVSSGEGTLSIARSFIESGTPTVINSLWAVNDQSTSEIMKSLYQYMHDGLTPNESLRKAKLNYIADNPEAHPYHWAGLISTTAIERTSNYQSSVWWISGMIILISITYLISKKYKTQIG